MAFPSNRPYLRTLIIFIWRMAHADQNLIRSTNLNELRWKYYEQLRP
jgi:hypothetical protein